jgi:hypothetical protein
MATTEYTGNAIPAPGLARGSVTTDEELLYASNPGSYHQKGVTLEPGQGVLPLGTILAQKTSTKRYVKYASGGSDGSGTALGILRKTVDTGTDADGQVWMANILYAGILKLAPVSSANSGVTLTSILAAQVNTVEGFFKF